MVKQVITLVMVVISLAKAQDLSCPKGSPVKAENFYVIGASGGDCKMGCENTAEATQAGLAAGMTAVELDISMSQDKVVFLWNDPVPLEPTAQARSGGLFVQGICRPMFGSLTPARGQVFEKIRENFKYANSSGVDQQVVIPTLHEWMNQFAQDDRIKLIVLDLKVSEVEQADFLVTHIMDKATSLGVKNKMRLLSPSYDMAAALQTSLARANYEKDFASRVLGGTVGTIHLGRDSTAGFDPVATAVEECYGTTSVGQSVSSNGWREYQEIVRRMVTTRNEQARSGSKYIPVLVWRINSVEQMAWLMCQGVDGVYTDEPRLLSMMAQRRELGDIVCCATDVVLPCLSNADTRVSGQGCASLGLSWHAQESSQCPLLPFPLDFGLFGTQLTCRQSRFCPRQP